MTEGSSQITDNVNRTLCRPCHVYTVINCYPNLSCSNRQIRFFLFNRIVQSTYGTFNVGLSSQSLRCNNKLCILIIIILVTTCVAATTALLPFFLFFFFNFFKLIVCWYANEKCYSGHTWKQMKDINPTHQQTVWSTYSVFDNRAWLTRDQRRRFVMTITHAVTLQSEALREPQEVRIAVDYCVNMTWATQSAVNILCGLIRYVVNDK